jgi:radical SAM protein with 4Fe4S-binding SPASM domain
MNITLNPNYVLKNDDGCVLLLAKKALPDVTNINESVNATIHPFHAMILSFVNGDEYDIVLSRASEQLQIDREKIKKFIDPLIENDKQIGPLYKNMLLGFPINTIIKSDAKRPKPYKPSDFAYSYLDVKTKRHKTPSTLTLMVNNKCATNCIYCYADKRIPTDCKIPFERIAELVAEAKKLGVISFELIGGEVFLYKQWRDLLKLYLQYGYEPFLSAKYPLTEDDVKFLADISISHIQISLDTMIPENLKKILRVNDEYVSRIQKTFEYIDKYRIPVVVHSIVANANDSLEDMISIYEFLYKFNNIKYWLPEIAGPSIYTGEDDFDAFKARKENILEMQNCIDELIKKSKIKIINGLTKMEDVKQNYSQERYDERFKNFMSRGLCSGNFSHMYILPTGDVTICEELYWHPKFIIGNVLTQSLEEIWNSEKALSLFYMKQNEIPADSACADCEDFNKCRDIRQICYRDLIKAYGADKWYYPDANCPKVPKPKNSTKL